MSGNHKNKALILKMVVQGHSNKHISAKLGIKIGSVKYHITNLLKENKLSRRGELISANFESMAVEKANQKINELTLKLNQANLEISRLKSVSLPMGR